MKPVVALVLVAALAACSSSAPSRLRDAPADTVIGVDGRPRDYVAVRNAENDFDLYIVAPEGFLITDRPVERRERMRGMQIVLQKRCPAGRTAEIYDPQDGVYGRELYARGRCV